MDVGSNIPSALATFTLSRFTSSPPGIDGTICFSRYPQPGVGDLQQDLRRQPLLSKGKRVSLPQVATPGIALTSERFRLEALPMLFAECSLTFDMALGLSWRSGGRRESPSRKDTKLRAPRQEVHQPFRSHDHHRPARRGCEVCGISGDRLPG